MSFEVADGPHLRGGLGTSRDRGGLGRHDLGSGAAAERTRACCSFARLSIQLNQTNERTGEEGHQRCKKEGRVLYVHTCMYVLRARSRCGILDLWRSENE